MSRKIYSAIGERQVFPLHTISNFRHRNLSTKVIQYALDDTLSDNARIVLTECREQLKKHGASCLEYPVLAFDLLGML